MGLAPGAFWQLTPREFLEQIQGWRWRYRQSQELVLSAALLIVAPWVEHVPTVQELLGEYTDDGAVDRLLGTQDPVAELEAAVQKQQANRLKVP